MTFEEAVAHALSRTGTEHATHYGQPAVKANGHVVLNAGNEPETSFVLHLDRDVIDLLMATHADTFWQTPHYAGYAAVLVRYDAPDQGFVRETIEGACAGALAKRPAKPRKR